MKKQTPRDLTELPVYEIICEEEAQGIRMVSLVKDPAIDVKGMYFSAEDIEKEKTYAFKAVEDKQIIVGPAMIANKKILRIDENDNMYYVYFSPETIKVMVDKFNSQNNNKSINVDHSNKMVSAFIQQNWIIEDPTYDKSRFYGFNLPVGSWFIEVKIQDEDFWKSEVKDAGKYGFSVEGLMGQELVKMETDMNKFIDGLISSSVIKMNFGDILDTNRFVVEPKAGETEEEFISRCIGEEINSGYEKDQAAAICYAKWDDKSMESEVGQELVKMETDMNKFIDSLTSIELLSLFCHCNEMEFDGEPGLVHPNCKCSVKKGTFITNQACDICNEARDAWNNSGAFMNVFGDIYSKKDFGEKASIGFKKHF